MNKRNILVLTILGIVLVVIGFVVSGASLAGAAAACQGATDTSNCGSGAVLGGSLIALLVFLVGGVAGFIAWIMGLVKTAQIGRWGWFVAVLLLGMLGTLIYGLAGPTERAA